MQHLVSRPTRDHSLLRRDGLPFCICAHRQRRAPGPGAGAASPKSERAVFGLRSILLEGLDSTAPSPAPVYSVPPSSAASLPCGHAPQPHSHHPQFPLAGVPCSSEAWDPSPSPSLRQFLLQLFALLQVKPAESPRRWLTAFRWRGPSESEVSSCPWLDWRGCRLVSLVPQFCPSFASQALSRA